MPIIKQNPKNIKNKRLIKKFTEKEEEIYRKRMKIENYHSWIKKFPKINALTERKLIYYEGFLLLGISIILHRRIFENKHKHK